MSARMKAHHIKKQDYIAVKVGLPNGNEISYRIPQSAKDKLNSYLGKLDISTNQVDPWENAILWEKLAKDRIKKYKKVGLVLRGARYREGLSQIDLSKKSKVHQNEISKIENGKRPVGEKVAKRLARALHFDYRLLLE